MQFISYYGPNTLVRVSGITVTVKMRMEILVFAEKHAYVYWDFEGILFSHKENVMIFEKVLVCVLFMLLRGS